MKIDVSPFRVGEGEDVSLAERPTLADPFYIQSRTTRIYSPTTSTP